MCKYSKIATRKVILSSIFKFPYFLIKTSKPDSTSNPRNIVANLDIKVLTNVPETPSTSRHKKMRLLPEYNAIPPFRNY